MQRAKSITIPDTGNVNLTSDVLARYGLKAGDEVSLIEVEAGVLIASKNGVIEGLLDQIGNSLSDKGITLEVLMERSPEIRKQLLQEMYGIDDQE